MNEHVASITMQKLIDAMNLMPKHNPLPTISLADLDAQTKTDVLKWGWDLILNTNKPTVDSQLDILRKRAGLGHPVGANFDVDKALADMQARMVAHELGKPMPELAEHELGAASGLAASQVMGTVIGDFSKLLKVDFA